MKEKSRWWLWLMISAVVIATLEASLCLMAVEAVKPLAPDQLVLVYFSAGAMFLLVCLVGTIARLKNKEQAYNKLAERIHQILPPTATGEAFVGDTEECLRWLSIAVTNDRKVSKEIIAIAELVAPVSGFQTETMLFNHQILLDTIVDRINEVVKLREFLRAVSDELERAQLQYPDDEADEIAKLRAALGQLVTAFNERGAQVAELQAELKKFGVTRTNLENMLRQAVESMIGIIEMIWTQRGQNNEFTLTPTAARDTRRQLGEVVFLILGRHRPKATREQLTAGWPVWQNEDLLMDTVAAAIARGKLDHEWPPCQHLKETLGTRAFWAKVAAVKGEITTGKGRAKAAKTSSPTNSTAVPEPAALNDQPTPEDEEPGGED